jgi:hypothetical protein
VDFARSAEEALPESLTPCLGAQEGFEQRCRARGIATFVLDPHDAILLACDTLRPSVVRLRAVSK